MARPHKFTQATVDLILEGVRKGLPYKVAAEAAGVHYDTFNEWRKGELPQGRNKVERQAIADLFSEFSEALTRARAEGIGVLHDRIREASEKDWRAALALLERMDPDNYGRNRLEITGKDGGPIELTEVVDTRIARIAERFGISEEAVRARLAASKAGDAQE